MFLPYINYPGLSHYDLHTLLVSSCDTSNSMSPIKKDISNYFSFLYAGIHAIGSNSFIVARYQLKKKANVSPRAENNRGFSIPYIYRSFNIHPGSADI